MPQLKEPLGLKNYSSALPDGLKILIFNYAKCNTNPIWNEEKEDYGDIYYSKLMFYAKHLLYASRDG